MPDEEIPREDELEDQQGKLYPVGRALRRTFDADNHDSLGTDLTGLMLELARIDPEQSAPGRGALPLVAQAQPPVAPEPTPAPPRGWLRRQLDRLLA